MNIKYVHLNINIKWLPKGIYFIDAIWWEINTDQPVKGLLHLFYVFFLNSYLYAYIALDICKGKLLNFILLLIFSRHFLVFVYILVLFVSPQSAGDWTQGPEHGTPVTT